jgi:YhcH/YjgK/YiaL family protein
MLLEPIDRLSRYVAAVPGLQAGLDVLAGETLPGWSDGEHATADPNVRAIVAHYTPKPTTDAVWESHRRHVDVQIVLAGLERLGHVAHQFAPAVRTPYDDQRDVEFYEPSDTWVTLGPGFAAILFPDDIHAPGVVVEAAPSAILQPVHKVVFKLRGDWV